LAYDGILDRFTLLSQSMIFLKVFFHSLHNTAGRTVATEAEFGTDCQRPLQNALFRPISASGSNFNPQNTQCIPAVKIFVFLELERN